MLVSQNSERARSRYAAILYRSALLLNPDPVWAGRAVAGAFAKLDWTTGSLDDETEVRLLAALPALPRVRRLRKRAVIPGPTRLWQLPPPTRLALWLRLVRGMDSAAIGSALRLPPATAQGLILDGLARWHDGPAVNDDTCRSCLLRRLDEPAAGRAHLLGCESCRATVIELERAESELGQQLGRLMSAIALPRSVDEALEEALAPGASRAAPALWQRPLVWQLLTIGLVVLGLGFLLQPHVAGPATGSGAANERGATPRGILGEARQRYASVPGVDGILHRRWQITIDRPQLTFVADEWVDPQQPARHRMQLMTDQTTREWQVGDGEQALQYVSGLEPLFCGGGQRGTPSRTVADVWHVGAAQQAEMRTVRWSHGAWAIGLHYLDLAAGASEVRSLGLVGNGKEAALTVSAAGPTIDGTLVFRFDPASHELQEVRQIQTNNGQTQEHVPWRLVASDIVDRSEAGHSGILIRYPGDARPDLAERALPIIDPACPPSGPDQAQSLPRLLAAQGQASGQLWGLPTLPPGIDHAVIIGPGDPAKPGDHSGPGAADLNTMRVVYTGPTKRLVLSQGGPQFALSRPPQSGPWQVSFFGSGVPSVLRASLQSSSGSPLDHSTLQRTGIRVQAEGWTKDELIALLAGVRPLRLEDWAQAPDRFYEPLPLDAELRDRLLRILKAVPPQAGSVHHRNLIITTRQNPAEATLTDPYHLPPDQWPATRRIESWTEADPVSGAPLRWRESTSDLQGQLLVTSWADGAGWHTYTAGSNIVITDNSMPGSAVPPPNPVTELLRSGDWHWSSSSDGSMVAERTAVLPSQAFDGLYERSSVDDWTTDLGLRHGIERLLFSADGTFQARETWATARGTVPGAVERAEVLIHRDAVAQDEWLARVPDETWTFGADSPITQLKRADIAPLVTNPGSSRLVDSTTEAAAEVPFPVWAWPANDATFAGGMTRVPWSPTQDQPVFGQATFEHALNLGVAIQIRYDLPYGPAELTEGPTYVLHRLLLQTAPRWTTSELRVVAVHGQTCQVWVMDGKSSTNAWMIWELDNTLFAMHFLGQPPDIQTVIDHLDTLQVVPAQHT